MCQGIDAGEAMSNDPRGTQPDRTITFLSKKDVARLAEAGLGTACRASTPFGQLPAVDLVSEEVYRAYQQWYAEHGQLFQNGGVVDYLIQRFRLRVVK